MARKWGSGFVRKSIGGTTVRRTNTEQRFADMFILFSLSAASIMLLRVVITTGLELQRVCDVCPKGTMVTSLTEGHKHTGFSLLSTKL